MDAFDEMNVRRFADILKRQILTTLEDDEDYTIPWTTESYRKYLTGVYDDMIKNGVLQKYDISQVFVDKYGWPQGDIYVVPARPVDYITLSVKISKENAHFSDILA